MIAITQENSFLHDILDCGIVTLLVTLLTSNDWGGGGEGGLNFTLGSI